MLLCFGTWYGIVTVVWYGMVLYGILCYNVELVGMKSYLKHYYKNSYMFRNHFSRTSVTC